jgi:tRNA (cmo5U34)-methyltransferase
MAQFPFDPDTYPELIAAEIPAYDELQGAVAAAAAGPPAERILDLGTGTGVTAQRVLDVHPEATVVGVDESEAMLAQARRTLPPTVELRVARLEDPLPEGPFDLVVSALAIHHLDGPGKAELFRRVARALTPTGRFVMADVVVPDDPVDAVTPIEPGHDLPSTVPEQLDWLQAAGLVPTVTWSYQDLAVLVAQRASP